MKRYKLLYDKICKYENVLKAHRNARKGKAHYTEVKMVNGDEDKYISEVQALLLHLTYKPSPYREKTINDKGKERLIAKLRRKFKDKPLMWLLDLIIDSYDKGVPIGNYTSQYFANFYLNDLDHYCKEKLHLKYFRYMDDICIIGEKEKLLEAYRDIKDKIEKLKLKLHPYIIKPIKNHKIDFVGYKFDKDSIGVRQKIAKNYSKVCKRIKHKYKINKLTEHIKISYNSIRGWYISGGVRCVNVLRELQKKTTKTILMKEASKTGATK